MLDKILEGIFPQTAVGANTTIEFDLEMSKRGILIMPVGPALSNPSQVIFVVTNLDKFLSYLELWAKTMVPPTIQKQNNGITSSYFILMTSHGYKITIENPKTQPYWKS